MPAPATGPELLELVEKSGLYEPSALHARLAELSILSEKPTNLAASMVKHGLITKFQAKLLLVGKYRGFRIGPYVLSDMIGQGGMGAVYEAKHLQLNRRVAIKVLTPGKDDNMKLAIERFLREARAAAALDHPNIVRLHDVGQFGLTHYLVMEFVEGETLEQIVDKKGPLPCQKAVEYICQAASGLQHAHEKGFIHRDIKPSNLILTKDGTIKVLDMGLARSTDDRDKLTGQIDMNVIVGTADFISPEQAVNDPDIDIRSDIYSLGATFFMLVTGGSPFKGNTAQKLVQHQVKEAPSLTRMDKTLPKELANVVAKMMAKKKEQRYVTPAEVISAFMPWLPNSGKVVAGLTQTHAGLTDRDTMDTIVASSTKQITKSIQRASQNPKAKWGMIGGGIAATIAVGAGLGWWYFGGSAPEQKASFAQVGPVPRTSPEASNSGNTGLATVPVNATVTKPTARPTSLPAGKSLGALFSFTPNDFVGSKYTLKGREAEVGTKPSLPEFIQIHCWKADSTADFHIVGESGVPAIRFGNRTGPVSAQVRLDFEKSPGGSLTVGKEYEFRCTYKTAGGANGRMSIVTSKHKYLKGYNLPDAPEWRTESFLFTRPDEALSLNIDAANSTEAGWVSIAKVEVIDVEASKQAKPLFAARFPNSPLGRVIVDKPGKSISQFHKFQLPPHVRLNHHNGDATAEYAIVDADGDRAVQMTLLAGMYGAQCHFNFEQGQPMPAGTPGLIRLTYRLDGAGQGQAGIEENAKPFKKYAMTPLPATGGRWKTVEIPFVRPETANPLDIIVNPGRRPTANEQTTIAIRSLEVFADAPAKPAAKVDLTTPITGTTIYELPITGTPAFDLTAERNMAPVGTAPKWDGVNLHAWKDGSVGQFRLNDQGDGLELSITNLNETTSAQLMVQLEFEMGIKLQTGKAYRVIVDYRTKNEGKGELIFQSENYSVLRTVPLSDTAGQWNRFELPFTRENGKPIRVGINSLGAGEGNSVSIRRLVIVEAN